MLSITDFIFSVNSSTTDDTIQPSILKSFNKDFGKQFYLLSKEEILNNKIFGEYNQDSKHELFESSIGDFIAFPKDSSNSILLGECDQTNNVSFHGGYSDDEIFIPLIVISN